MRIELIYSPGCLDYQSALNKLEYIIAEERLPLPVELIEDTLCQSPIVRIDGETVDKERISAISSAACHEHIREILSRKWRELTILPLRKAS